MPRAGSVMDAMRGAEMPKSFMDVWKLLYSQRDIAPQIAYVTPNDLLDALDEGISYVLGVELAKFLSGGDTMVGFPLPYADIISYAISHLRRAGKDILSETGIRYGSEPCLNYLQSDLSEYAQLQEAFQSALEEVAKQVEAETGKRVELKIFPDVTNTVSLRIEARKLD
jgi:hypothetical protein